MNIFKKKSKKVVNDVTQTEIVSKVGKGSLFMKTIGMISTINTQPTIESSESTQMSTINSPEIARSKGNKISNSEIRVVEGKLSKVRSGEQRNSDNKNNTPKVDSMERDKVASSIGRTGVTKSNVTEGKPKGSRSRPAKMAVERPNSLRLGTSSVERPNSVTLIGINENPVIPDQSVPPKKKIHALESEQNLVKKEIEDLRLSMTSVNKIPTTMKPPPSNLTTNGNLNVNNLNNTKEIFWEIANFDLAKPLYESNTFSYADQCWNFIFGHNGSENYGFLMSLHQPQIASIQFKCTFKLHHPFAFPLSKTREEPYVFGINSRTIRGFVNFASREEVSRHVQEGGILKLSAVLKLTSVVLVPNQSADGTIMGGLKTSDDRLEKESNGHPLFTSSYGSDPQGSKLSNEAEKLRGRATSISPTESEGESWLPCFGFSFSIFKSAASFKRFFSSFMQKRNDKKEKDKRKRKEIETRGRPIKEKTSYGFFGSKKTVKSSDSENDSDGDDAQDTVENRYNVKRDGQRRSNEIIDTRDNKGRGDRGRMGGDKGKYWDEQMDADNNRPSMKRDSSDLPNREMQNLIISRRDMLSGRDSDSDASPNARKNCRQDERIGNIGKPSKDVDSHERNKSFSPETSRGMEKKMTERHFRNNSSMI